MVRACPGAVHPAWVKSQFTDVPNTHVEHSQGAVGDVIPQVFRVYREVFWWDFLEIPWPLKVSIMRFKFSSVTSLFF